MEISDYLTMTEAAEYSGRDVSTLRRAAIRGSLKARKMGTIWVATRADVDAYLAAANATQRGKHMREDGPDNE